MLLIIDKFGLYCAIADVYIDPWRGVNRAIITHAHSDHARCGSKNYLCHKFTEPILKLRLGKNINTQSVEYNQSFSINGVKFTLFPAGHIIGSAQIRIEYNGEICVVSGDYKTQDDGVCAPFESIKCHHFITESTFGLPIYNFANVATQKKNIIDWVAENNAQGNSSVFVGYSLGKSQRLAKYLQEYYAGRIYMHSAIQETHQAFYEIGAIDFSARNISEYKNDGHPAIFLVSPSSNNRKILQQIKQYKTAMCSGWMQLSTRRKIGGIDKGFAMSDHADWQQLLAAVASSQAENIYVTHGYSKIFSKYLREEKKLNAVVLESVHRLAIPLSEDE